MKNNKETSAPLSDQWNSTYNNFLSWTIQRTAALIVEFGSCFSLRKENAWPGLNTLLQKVLPALTISETEKNVLAVYVALILRGFQDRTAICEVA